MTEMLYDEIPAKPWNEAVDDYVRANGRRAFFGLVLLAEVAIGLLIAYALGR